jgi:spermidine synthase
MRVPIWKLLLSYIAPISLEVVEGTHTTILQVNIRNGQFQLCTNNAIYSYGNRYTNFREVFRYMPIENFPIRKVLLLGLGLGSIPYMLEKSFKRRYRYTAIELDKVVIELARKYTLDELKSDVECICNDATRFVQNASEKYELICIDLFLDDIIPQRFKQDAFLKQVAQLLSAEGIILYNCLYMNHKDKTETDSFFQDVFLSVFPDGSSYHADGNLILINRAIP